MMIHARDGDRDAVYNDMTGMQRANECLKVVMNDTAYTAGSELQALIVNTTERVYAYRDSSLILGGGSFPRAPRSKWRDSCNFDLDAVEN